MVMPANETVVPAKTEVAQTTAVVPEQAQVPAPVAEAPAPPTYTASEVAKMVQEAADKAAEKAAAMAHEIGRRNLQSQQDRNRGETLRQQRINQNLAARLKGTPYEQEAAAATLEAKVQTYEEEDLQRVRTEQEQQARNEFYGIMTDALKGMGVDTNDKSIDWAYDATDAKTAQKRILASAATAQKTTLTAKLKADLKKEIRAEIEKELGINSISAETPSGGTIGNGIPRAKKSFEKWYLGLSDAEAKRREKEINEVIDSGLIR